MDELAERVVAAAAAEGAPVGTVPKRWEKVPTWRCTNGHVSKSSIEGRGKNRLCAVPQCGVTVRLTFPEDHTGPLP